MPFFPLNFLIFFVIKLLMCRLVGNFESYSTTNSPEGNRPAASEDPGTKSNILSPSSNQAEWNQITRKLEKIIPDFKPAGTDLLSVSFWFFPQLVHDYYFFLFIIFFSRN